ncbi:uncharacterized protein TRUGW13939_04520 [Talaromyces rugulosus]|uniref:Uncharacterized protein n=1 Tax=Talaromyces rugulosus TaxID=121627 RepID=A0A7H8QUK1_TALRU|nr:uncharacterized protein TRUGW13939_04520 [Talaromyces rugulosus]QKX57408.1 hypothetical protein TRUGW13939_04520 [Talaromyces rugulosus]
MFPTRCRVERRICEAESTREDRYEPKGIAENEKTPIPAEAIRKKKLIGKRKGNPRIGERFYAENIRSGRLTFNFNENLGIFKKGKTSVPVHCSDVSVPYLNFSETKFLSNEPQTLQNAKDSAEEIQEPKRLGEDESIASRFKKPLRRPQDPKDATSSHIYDSKILSRCRPDKTQNGPGQGQPQAIEGRDPSLERPSVGDRCFLGLDADSSLLDTRTSRNTEFSVTSIDERLFDSLGNCDQLTIPYEEYKPTFINGFLYTLEDLKCLCTVREHLRSGADVDYTRNTTKANLERILGAEDSLGNHDMLSLAPELMDVTEETLLEYLFDIESRFTKDATFNFLECGTNPGELDPRITGTYPGLNTDSNKNVLESDLEKLLPFTTSDLTHPNQSRKVSGEISRLRSATLSDTEATKQVAAIESSLLDGSSLLGGTFPRNIDQHLLPMSFRVRDQAHDEPAPFWAIDVPPRLISQNAHLNQSRLGNVPERRFWRRHRLY